MTVIRYIGTQDRWPELAVTGRQSMWFRGQQEDRPDAETAQLMATGLFRVVPVTPEVSSGPDGGFAVVLPDRSQVRLGTRANAQITRYGVPARAGSWGGTCATNATIGVTSVTHSLSNERPRFETYTRRVAIGANVAEIRFASANFTADPVLRELSVDIYIEQMPSEYLVQTGGANPFITVQISNTTTLGSNFSRWSFGASYLRQGWNTLKFRAADPVSSVDGAGTLPTGQTRPADSGTGFDWSQPGQFFSMAFNNMNGFVVHIDQIRRPARARAVLTIGFDASGSGANDEVFLTKVAPLFAQYGIRSYCTMTNIYELVFSGSRAWTRLGELYNSWGWDIINHSWSHGATEVGRLLTPASVVASADTVTFTTSTAHGLALNRVIKISIQGATQSAFNGVWDATVNSTTTFTYSAPGSGTQSATGTIRALTYLSEVFTANTAENQRLLRHELTDISRVLMASGFTRGIPYAAMPNNAVPELSLLQPVCDQAGIKMIRAYRGGYTFVNEFGADNPLNMGSVIMDSGTGFTRTSQIKDKVAGCIERGEHLHIFGHFILDDEDPANVAFAPTAPDFPPSQGGNPNPPAGVALSGFGGWWYMSQLRDLVVNAIAPAIANGTLLVMSPSEYVAYMGGRDVV